MSEQVSIAALQQLVVGRWGTLEEENRRGIGDGWGLAEQFLALHANAARLISRAAGTSPSKSDQAIILLTGHGLNLFIETMGLLARGLFDVSAHLLRGLMDTRSHAYACASQEDRAARFMGGGEGMKVSDARKILVDDVRTQDSALADDLGARFGDDAKWANQLAHVNFLHGDKLTHVGAGNVTPVAWGMPDPAEARQQAKVALDQEHWLLITLKGYRPAALGQDWIAELDATQARFLEFMKS